MQPASFRSRWPLMAFLLAVGHACSGAIEDPAGAPAGAAPGEPSARGSTPSAPGDAKTRPPATEDPGDAAFVCMSGSSPAVTPLRRLSRREYTNTVLDLSDLFPDADKVREALKPRLDELPEDSSHPTLTTTVLGAPLRKLDSSVTEAHVERFFEIARAFADAATASEARVRSLVGDCAPTLDSDGGACLESFVRRFGRRVFRRPPRDAEIAFARQAAATAQAGGQSGLRAVVTLLLAMPGFVYHLEDDGKERSEGISELSAYEVASRLSFLLWQRGPDDDLLDAAARGELNTPEGLRARALRMFEDPRADEALTEFFSSWLENEHLGRPWELVGNRQYDAFRGGIEPTSALKEDMEAEVVRLARFVAREGTLSDLHTSTRSFARTPELASIYGVAPWNGTATSRVALPKEERAGLITRAAFVAADIHTTRPILKGMQILGRLLCEQVPPPPDNVPTEVTLTPPYTRRAATASLTQQPGSGCVACHNRLNPFGFVSEHYDALARHRREESYIDEQGKLVAKLPVSTEARILLDGQEHRVADALGLARLLATSPQAGACFSRHWVRFALGRPEEERDGCALESVRRVVARGGSLAEAMLAVALDPSFRSRRFGPP